MTGTVVNTLAIFVGGLLGWWAGSLLPEKLNAQAQRSPESGTSFP